MMNCCAAHGVTGVCLDVCSGNPATFPDNFQVCWQHIKAYASCYNGQSADVEPAAAGDCLPYK